MKSSWHSMIHSVCWWIFSTMNYYNWRNFVHNNHVIYCKHCILHPELGAPWYSVAITQAWSLGVHSMHMIVTAGHPALLIGSRAWPWRGRVYHCVTPSYKCFVTLLIKFEIENQERKLMYNWTHSITFSNQGDTKDVNKME